MSTLLEQTADVLALIKAARASGSEDLLFKTFTQNSNPTQGLQAYNLEPSAKQLYVVLTPFRNSIPRRPGGSGSAVNWKAVTAINSGRIAGGVAEGKRGGVVQVQTKEYNAAYRTLGFESFVTFEANNASKSFDDLKARASITGLQSLWIYEEMVLVGGNTSMPLGTTPTPTVSNAGSGGTIPAGTYNLVCVALTLEGLTNAGSVGLVNGAATQVQGQVTRTNIDGTTDSFGGGAAQKSTAGSTTTTGSTSTITGSVAVVPGAAAYAWFLGTAGAEKLAYISTINSVTLTALPNGVNQALSSIGASDGSTNSLIHDGVFTQMLGTNLGAPTLYQTVGSSCSIFLTATGSLWAQMASGTAGVGTALTADGAGGVVEIDAILKAMWDNARVSPDEIWVSSQELMNISKKVIAGGGTPLFRFNMDAKDTNNGLIAGAVVGSYLNKYTMSGGQLVRVRLHPNITPGQIFFRTLANPYPQSDTGDLLQVDCRQDYYQLDWPLKSRRWEYGVYTDQVLKNYFPPAFALLSNIANG